MGETVGNSVGWGRLGEAVGAIVGGTDGDVVGLIVGGTDGDFVGLIVRDPEGNIVGSLFPNMIISSGSAMPFCHSLLTKSTSCPESALSSKVM